MAEKTAPLWIVDESDYVEKSGRGQAGAGGVGYRGATLVWLEGRSDAACWSPRDRRPMHHAI